MNKINIIANNIVFLSESIIEEVEKTDNFSDFNYIITDCVERFKDILGIEKYIVYSFSSYFKNFYLEVKFLGRKHMFTIKFENISQSQRFIFKASLEKYQIIVDRPLRSYIEGIIYSGYFHNYLYVDTLTVRLPLRSFIIQADHILDGPSTNNRLLACLNFKNFYEKISKEEREHIKILNLDVLDLYDSDSKEYNDIKKTIGNDYVTCVVIPKILEKKILSHFPSDIPYEIITNEEEPTLLLKERWLQRTLSIINDEYRFPHLYWEREYYETIVNLIIDYHLSKELVCEYLSRLIDEKDDKNKYLMSKIKSIRYLYY